MKKSNYQAPTFDVYYATNEDVITSSNHEVYDQEAPDKDWDAFM